MPKNEEKALATAENQNLALDLSMFAEFQTGGVVLGLENVEASDIKMPRHKLLQSNSTEVSTGKGKPGQFINTLTGECVDELTVALLCMNRSRVRFAKPYKRGAQPMCRSFDAKHSQDGDICKGCEFADWDKAKEDGNNSPECRESLTWTFLEDGKLSDLPSRIIVSGASRAEHSKFITRLAGLGFPPFIFKTKITSEQTSNDNGIFYVMKFDLILNENGQPTTYTVEEARKMEIECKKWKGMQDRFAEFDTVNAVDDIVDQDSEGGIF